MRADPTALGGAAAVLALGVLVLLDGAGAMDLRFVVLVPVALAAAGMALLGAVAAPCRRRGTVGPSTTAAAAARPGHATLGGTKAARTPPGRILGGVCAGLGATTSLPAWAWRLGFAALTLVGGVGLVLYLGLWLLSPLGGRPGELGDLATAQVVAGGAMLALAALAAARSLGLPLAGPVVWPLVLLGAGALLLTSTSSPAGEEPTGSRTTVGTALIAGAAVLFLVSTGALAAVRDVALGAFAIAVVLAALFAPYLVRLARSLGAERAARIRSQERAELAAHLHDSVLQTLALVQRRADDPAEVAALARRQERELRAWLAGRGTRPGERPTLAAALETAAGDVEAAHGVAVEVVVVGDAPVGDREAALVAAAREAILNAAKFAGEAGPVAVYAEAGADGVHVFVRDRGPGFDPAAVPADRRGVRESIIGRMARHRGHATIGPAPGGGTEVELVLEP